jgi:hypothetical protein
MTQDVALYIAFFLQAFNNCILFILMMVDI